MLIVIVSIRLYGFFYVCYLITFVWKVQIKVTVNSEINIDLDQPVKSRKLQVASTITFKCTQHEATMNTLKRREDLFVHRLILNIINLGMQIGSICSLHDVAASIDNPKPCVATFLAMRFRYFTIWIVMLHIFYSGTDLTLMFYHHNEKIRTGTRVLAITEKLKYLIEGLFRCMLWPSSLMTTLFYWIVYIYVRKLIFPDFVDQVSGWGPYQFLHTWISMFVILDVLFRPRICPLSVILNMRFIFSYLLLYMNVFYYTGNAEGTWLDPISSTAYESCLANFIILHVFFLTMFPVFYILLWKVNNLKLFITGYLP